MKTILILCTAMSLVASIASAQKQCSTSYGCYGCVFDLHCVESWEPVFPPGGGQCQNACYDLPAGTIAVAVTPSCLGITQAVDRYQAFGPAPGQQVSFVVQLRVQGQISGSGVARARVRDLESGAEVALSFTSADSPVDRTLVLPLQHAAEDTFRVSYYLEGDGSILPAGGSVQLQGRFEFGDLPVGTLAVVSCQGYYQDQFPVATLRTTWGRLKAHYR